MIAIWAGRDVQTPVKLIGDSYWSSGNITGAATKGRDYALRFLMHCSVSAIAKNCGDDKGAWVACSPSSPLAAVAPRLTRRLMITPPLFVATDGVFACDDSAKKPLCLPMLLEGLREATKEKASGLCRRCARTEIILFTHRWRRLNLKVNWRKHCNAL